MVTNLFGIPGLTIGGLGIWGIFLLIVGGIAVWWVRGMPERKRASNEAVPVESAAMNVLFRNMQAEIKRMGAKVDKLEKRVSDLETEKRAVVKERDAALAENARLRAVNDGQGQMRAEAAAIVAVDRLEAKIAGAAQ